MAKITDLMTDYLRQHGVNTATQVFISTPTTRSQLDFQLNNGGTYVGEAKWEDNTWEGFGEARDYGQLTGVNGSFLITYPNNLKSEVHKADSAETLPNRSCPVINSAAHSFVETNPQTW